MTNILVNLTEQLGINNDRTTDKKSALIIIHGADGSIAPFYELAKLLNITVIAIRYLASFVSECNYIEHFACVYLTELLKNFSYSSYYFAGHSFGSLVAYEMAARAQVKEQLKSPIFMLDPNLPLAMRNYNAERLLELRVLSLTVIQQNLIEKYNVYQCDESQLLDLLSRCLKQNRIDEILATRKHCLQALSKYHFKNDSNLPTCMLHAGEKIAFDFTDQETKFITDGITVGGNHFTMLSPRHVNNMATIINSKLEIV